MEDCELPKAIVARIIKNALPAGAILQKEARLAVNRAATEFVNHLATISNRIAKESNDKSITTTHVMKALEMAELQELIGPITQELEVHRQITQEKKKRLKERRKVAINPDEASLTSEIPETQEEKEQILDITL